MKRGGGAPLLGNHASQKGGAVGSNAGGGVPPSIKCQVCNKMKPKEQYAKRQLLKFTPYNKTFARNPAGIRVTCKTCTPGQTTELTCYICDMTAGLDKFAKNQRKDPDKARCKKCVDKVLETEPDMSPPGSDEEDEEEDTDNDDEDWGTGRSSLKGPVSRGQGPRDSTSQYTATTGPGRYGSSLSSANTRPPAAPEKFGAAAGSRSYAASVASSVATSHATTNTHVTAQYHPNAPAPGGVANSYDDSWETVQSAGAPAAKYGTAWGARPATSTTVTSSYTSASTSRVAPIDMKSNGWAKVPKVQKGKEQKWGEGNAADYNKDEGGEDEWAKYGRDIRDAKAGKISKKKKKQVSSDSENDD